jgi:hypothetical protein
MNAGESAIFEPGRVQCVTPAQIDMLLERVTYSTHIIPGTTSVVAAAIAPGGYVLCVVEKACPSRVAFNPALAIEMAIGKAKGEARGKLWEMEEYRLSQALHESRQSVATTALEQARAVLGRDVPCRVPASKPCPCGLPPCIAAAERAAARG